MLRDPDRKTADGEYCIRRFIPESASEFQELARVMPDTRELPTTHEHYVEHGNEMRNGVPINFIEIGVRPKPTPAAKGGAAGGAGGAGGGGNPQDEADGLNALSFEALEVEAARVELDEAEFRKLRSKAARVEAIRAARKAKEQPQG